MTESVTVHVVKYASCKNWMMRYRDPATGKQIARSTGTCKRREAQKAAAKWEAQLHEGRYKPRSRMTWEEFREHYEANAMPGMKEATAKRYATALNAFEDITKPQRLSDLTTARVTNYATEVRKRGCTPATVACGLRHLKAIARWANRQGMLHTVPAFDMPKTSSTAKMKGRPITPAEFEDMLDAVPDVVGESAAPSWQALLRALWWSGLRLSESMVLSWEERPGAIVVDLKASRPLLRIPSEAEKGGRDRLVPMAPEFAGMLQAVPDADQTGWVFEPLRANGKPCARNRYSVGPTISAIGKAADIVVDRQGSKEKYASAHDLRRAFGFRWSRLVMPAVLRELMRHSSVATTMQYYVGINAEATAEELWEAVGKASGKAKPYGPALKSDNGLHS